MSQQHESGVVQSNVNPVLQPIHDNVPSGISEEPQLSQPQIEVDECSSNGISKEPQLFQPQIEDNECCFSDISEESLLSQHHIEDNECSPGGISEEPQLSQPQIEVNECFASGILEEPQLSQPQIEIDECSPSGISEELQLFQPQIEDNESCLSDTSEESLLSQHHIEDNECSPSGVSKEPQLSQPQIEVNECSPSGISEEPQLSQPQIEYDEFMYSLTEKKSLGDYEGAGGSSCSYRPFFNAAQKGHWKSVKSFFNKKKKSLGEYDRTGESYCSYLPLFNAAQKGDWKSAKSNFFDEDPDALTIGITCLSQTALHVAAISCQWGFILKLLEPLSREAIAVQDRFGNTILHYVAAGGSLKTAKALVQKNPDLPQMKDKNGHLPLITSIWSESNKELAWYLSLITEEVDSPLLLL
ncbi:hypothetical protein QYF36_008229 [Acer negundo]|nr:hypothetical protein QYF36_008229 [Acer negundo]